MVIGDEHIAPPRGFVAAVVELAMLDAEEWDGELIVDPGSHGARPPTQGPNVYWP